MAYDQDYRSFESLSLVLVSGTIVLPNIARGERWISDFALYPSRLLAMLICPVPFETSGYGSFSLYRF